MIAGEERAICIDGAMIALGVGAFAGGLTVVLDQQIGSGTGFEGGGGLCCDGLLGFAVGDGVAFAFSA